MPRKNIFEILKESYDIKNEIIKIDRLFSTPMVSLNRSDFVHRIENVVDLKIFFRWKGRHSCTSTSEMYHVLNIRNILQKDIISSDEVIICLEFYNNIVRLFYKYILKDSVDDAKVENDFNILVANIFLLEDYLNVKRITSEEDDNLLLVPKNPEAIAVAEISTEDTALAIMKYHHASLKGDLKGKRSLLLQISQEYEPLLSSKIDNYNDFLKNANALLNNLHIRHNNTSNEGNKNTLIDLSDEKLEEYYDELYQLLLFCVLIKDNLERKSKISKFLKQIKE